MQFQLVAGDVACITWLELLLLYEVRAEVAILADLGNVPRIPGPLDPHIRVKNIVRAFSTASRQVLQRHAVLTQHPTLFSVNRCAGVGLRRMGSSSALATVGFLPVVTVEESQTIHKAILALLGHNGAEPLKLLLQGNLWRPLKNMNCSLGATWKRPRIHGIDLPTMHHIFLW